MDETCHSTIKVYAILQYIKKCKVIVGKLLWFKREVITIGLVILQGGNSTFVSH